MKNEDYDNFNAFAIPNVPQEAPRATPNHPPAANAGQNQAVNESTTVTLNGVGSDPDPDDKLSYSWQQIAGPFVTLIKGNTTNPSFNAPSVSTNTDLKFSLIVKDDKGTTGKPVSVTITVRHINHNPLANAGNNQTVNPGYVVSLDGTPSKDPDGDPLSYSWVQVDGSPVKINGIDNAIATFTAPSNISKDTDLTFKLTVADTKNTTDISTIRVSIKHSPLPSKFPIADAGIDQIVNASSTVQLDASNSKDPEGAKIVSYSWIQIEGPPVTLSDANSQTPTFTAPTVSTDTPIKFTLSVNNDNGAKSNNPAKVTITIKYVNHPPIANAGQDQTVNAGNVVSLNGAASKDPDTGDELSYSWTQTSGPHVTLSSTDSAMTSFTAPKDITSDTEMIFELTVMDSKNATSKDSVKVTDKYLPPPNKQPVANAGNDQTVNSGSMVTLDGSGSKDPDGKIVSYSWKQNSGPLVILNNANGIKASFTAPTVSSDTELKFSLTVTDDIDTTSNPDIVTVTVKTTEQEQLLPSESNANETNLTNETSIPSVPSNDQTQLEASTEYLLVKKWGSSGEGDGQFGGGEFAGPEGIAIDSSGNVYVSDTYKSRIQKFDSNGKFITKWGSGGTGDGQFNLPKGIATDSSGNVYVVDVNNSRIQKFDSNGKFITKWGSNGTADGQFSEPTGIDTDTAGDVYVADWSNDRIQKFDSNGKFITKWGSPGSADGQFVNPYGIATDSSGNVYVTDFNNYRIQKFDSNGQGGSFVTEDDCGNCSFSYPSGIATDSSGNVYVAVSYDNLIMKFDSNGKFITKWESYGTGDRQFSTVGPFNIATDSSGNVYVADSVYNNIVKFAPSNN